MTDHIGDANEMVLKPCPFCGGEAKLGYSTAGEGWWGVHCIQCRVTSYAHHDKNIAINLWNRRTPEPGTSVVRWIKCEEAKQILPPEEHYCLLRLQNMTTVGDLLNNRWWVWDSKGQRSIDLPVAYGDMWAYLPEPPEGMDEIPWSRSESAHSESRFVRLASAEAQANGEKTVLEGKT